MGHGVLLGKGRHRNTDAVYGYQLKRLTTCKKSHVWKFHINPLGYKIRVCQKCGSREKVQ